jgi:hypothetical protein
MNKPETFFDGGWGGRVGSKMNILVKNMILCTQELLIIEQNTRKFNK